MRTGVIARKLGMTARFTKNGRVPVTVLKLDDCQVLGHRVQDKNGYDALQIGAGTAKASRVSKPLKGQYAKSKLPYKRRVLECRIDEKNFIDIGSTLKANHYVAGQKIDVIGKVKGKGFQGVIKRHGFHGLRATHGVSISHRSHGSTGQCQDPGKVFKGKKMAGQMGNVRRTQQNLEVFEVLVDKDLILVKGSVPGSAGSYVVVKDAVKFALPENAPLPGGFEKFATKKANDGKVKDKVEDKTEDKTTSTKKTDEVVDVVKATDDATANVTSGVENANDKSIDKSTDKSVQKTK